MSKYKKISLLLLLIMLNFIISSKKQLSAHEVWTSVEYDDCIPYDYDGNNHLGYGYYEKWYMLKKIHLDNSVATIHYYINETVANGEERWNDFFSESEKEYVLSNFINGLYKWNNTYFYYQSDEGILIRKKIINVQERSSDNLILALN